MEKGDPVTVILDGPRFPWMPGHGFDAILRHEPQGPGDTYEFKVVISAERPFGRARREDHHGRTVKVNGNSSALIGIYERDPEGE